MSLIEAFLAVWAVLGPALVYFIKSWFDGRPKAEASILKQLREHEGENAREHRTFRTEIRELDLRLAKLETALPAALERLDDVKEGLADLSQALAAHVETEERFQRELSRFMGRVEASLPSLNGLRKESA